MSDSIGQHTAWASGQAADAYFARNREKLDAARPVTRSTRFLASAVRRGSRLLEIGPGTARPPGRSRHLTPAGPPGPVPPRPPGAVGHRAIPMFLFAVGREAHR